MNLQSCAHRACGCSSDLQQDGYCSDSCRQQQQQQQAQQRDSCRCGHSGCSQQPEQQ